MTVNRLKKTKFLIDYLIITLGSLSLSVGVIFLLIPHNIPSAGPPGVAILLDYLFMINPAISLLAVNVPLLMLGRKTMGRVYFFRSLYAITFTSIFTYALPLLMDNQALGEGRLVYAIYAGVLIGLGISFVFLAGGAAGGWNILAQWITTKIPVSTGTCLFVQDFLVIAVTAMVFNDLEAAMLGGISVFVASIIVDKVIELNSAVKMVCLLTQSPDIKTKLEQKFNLKLSATRVDNDYCQLIFFFVSKTKFFAIKQYLAQEDSSARLLDVRAMERG